MSKGDYLGEFEQLVLLALMRLGEGAYGMAVRREIEERTGREVAIGAVYATLDRLEAKGLVTSAEGQTAAGRGGRARRFFSVSGAGLRALRRSQEALDRMWDGLPHGAKA
jgi:PadR family transcriptional regulator, regulatory protein PadR